MKNSLKFITGFVFALLVISCEQKNSVKRKKSVPALSKAELEKYSQATFAGGCFWCVESIFESVTGVKEAVSGYAGGTEQNPSYEEVGSGSTGHAETVNIYYDSSEVSFPTLLKVYFASEDPTQVNGQGPDIGKQYRSVVFYRNEDEKKLAQDYIQELNSSGMYDAPVAAKVVPFVKFWDAEDYHQDYILNNPYVPYVRIESVPRIKKFQKKFPELIKPDHRF